MTPAVMADIAASGPRAELLHGPLRQARVSTALMTRTRTRSIATSTTVFVDQRHHGTRLARKVAAGIAAETSPTSAHQAQHPRPGEPPVPRRGTAQHEPQDEHRQGRADEPDDAGRARRCGASRRPWCRCR